MPHTLNNQSFISHVNTVQLHQAEENGDALTQNKVVGRLHRLSLSSVYMN